MNKDIYFFLLNLSTFSFLNALARTSNTVLARSGERGNTCLVPVLRGKVSSFSPLSMKLAVGFLMFFIDEEVPFYSQFAETFYHDDYWIFSNDFLASIDVMY